MRRAPLSLGVLVLALAASPALAAAPPGLPGPPPGTGTGFPLPPGPGQGPPPQASLPAASITGTAYGPGLLSGYAAVSGRRLPVKIACQGKGKAQLHAAGVAVKAIYRCAGGRSTIGFALTGSQARQLASGQTIGSLTLTQGAATESLSLWLGRSAPAPAYWTSFYGLGCGSNSAELTAPNFSDTTTTTVDVRPWIAWYTPAAGWQWLGVRGPDASAWYQWTATPTGVAEWQQPTGTSPWTWGPIAVTPGHGTYVIAAFEAIYWYSHPSTVWEYARSGPNPSTITTYCVYP
jgi:hypothetical protein